MKNATIIQHLAFENLGILEPLLKPTYNLTFLQAGIDSLINIQTDLLIILGGPIGVYDEPDYLFLTDELKLLERRLAQDLPTLGICLGCQLMARALGSKVYPSGYKEIGWSPIQLTDQGQQSPLKPLHNQPVLHWHGDTFDLPQGAHHLASSKLCTQQAFQYKNSLALQFHLEVTPTGLESWFIGHAAEIGMTENLTVKQLRRDTKKWGVKLMQQGEAVFSQWLKTLP
ncbi:glutamine amidotransferase [Magnetococcales bacterium HHB-1]